MSISKSKIMAEIAIKASVARLAEKTFIKSNWINAGKIRNTKNIDSSKIQTIC